MAAAQIPGSAALAETAAVAEAPIETPAAETAATEVAEPAELSEEARMEAALAELSGEAPKSKPKTNEKKPEVEKKEEIPSIEEQSRSFAALKHKTQRFNDERAAFTAEKTKHEETVAAQKAELAALRAELDGRREKAKKTPLDAMRELGWTPDQIVKYLSSGGEVPQERIYEGLRDELKKELDSLREETKKERETREAEAKQRAEAQEAEKTREMSVAFQRKVGVEMVDVYKSEPDKFKHVGRKMRRDPGPVHREVLNLIAAEFSKTKKVLAISDAMLQIEREAASWFDEDQVADPGQAGAVVESANPGSIEPIPKLETARRGNLPPKKTLEEMTSEEREELALRELAE